MKTLWFDEIMPLFECCASQGSIRHTLKGVYLNKDVGEACATDGHRMVIVKNEGIKNLPESVIVKKPFLVPNSEAYLHFVVDEAGAKWFGTIKRNFKTGPHDIEIDSLDKFQRLQRADIVKAETYPNYAECIPAPQPDEKKVVFDPGLLRSICRVCAKEKSVEFTIGDKNKGIKYRGKKYSGLIMPLNRMEGEYE